DNTSDASKPVSTAQQAALDLKADATALTTETNARIDADNRREFAGGVAFDGSSNFATISNLTNVPSAFEISGWFYFDSNANQSISLVSKYGTDNAMREWLLGYNFTSSQDKLVLRLNDSENSVSVDKMSNIITGGAKWRFLLVRYDGRGGSDAVNGITIKVNNFNVTGSSVNNSSFVNIVPSSQPVWLRRASVTYGQGNEAFRDFAIFNTALTATQAAELYQQGLQPWLAANPEYRRGMSDPIYQSDFSSGTDGWGGSGDEDGVTISQNSAGIGGQSNTIIATLDSSVGVHAFWDDLDRYNGTGLFKIKFDVYIPSNQNINGAQVTVSSEGSNLFQPILNPTLDSWNTYESNTFKRTAVDSNRIYFYLTDDNVKTFTGNGTDFAHFKNIEITQIGSLATLPLDDDCRQLKDISGNRNDATASESGVTHLKQKDLHAFRDDNADGTGGSYLIANADILAENEVIVSVVVDGRFYAASGAQDLTKRRIKLQDHGSHVDVKRSNGTTDDSAIAVTNPSDGTDFAISVLTQRI
ncbi:MAG: LamG domain-containing protein, partial [Planctomycetaceae bacterium]|nr:LamG domain-containing protein [Planctomycetaceae bacterium]